MMRRPENARVLTQAEALNQLFDAKAFSWTLAMEAMETVLPAGVQVTSIEPIRAPDGHITVHVRVVGPRDKADDLVANLEQSRRFLEPRIVGENAESSNNPSQRQEPISISNRFDFDLLAEYNPPTLLEATSQRRAHRCQARPSAIQIRPFPSASKPQAFATQLLRSRKAAAVRHTLDRREEVRNERERNSLNLPRAADIAAHLALSQASRFCLFSPSSLPFDSDSIGPR